MSLKTPNPTVARLTSPVCIQPKMMFGSSQDGNQIEAGVPISELTPTDTLLSTDILIVSRQNDQGKYSQTVNLSSSVMKEYVKKALLNDEQFIKEMKNKIIGTIGTIAYQRNHDSSDTKVEYGTYTIDDNFKLTTIEELGFVQVGYEFLGWTDIETGKTYEDGDTACFSDGNTTLKATWNITTGNIYYNSNYPQ